MCSMKFAKYIIALSVAAIGCSRSSESTRTPSTPETQVALPAEAVDGPDPEWREMFFEDSERLANVPEITIVSTDGNVVRVTAKNAGTTTLQYYSAGAEHVQLFQEIKEIDKWTQSNWDWCGTGKEVFDIAPNESVELEIDFWDEDKQERMLANFSEKDTNRSGLVVLAIEPEK